MHYTTYFRFPFRKSNVSLKLRNVWPVNASNLVVVHQKAHEMVHEMGHEMAQEMAAEIEMMIEVVGAVMIEAEIVIAILAVEMIAVWMIAVWMIVAWMIVVWMTDVVEMIAEAEEMIAVLEELGKLAEDLGVTVNVKETNNGLLEGEMMMVPDVTLMIAEMTVAMIDVTIAVEKEMTGVLVQGTCLKEVLQGKIGVAEMIAVIHAMTGVMTVVTIAGTWTEVAWIVDLIVETEGMIAEEKEVAGDLDLEMDLEMTEEMTDVTIVEDQEVHQEMIAISAEEMIDVVVAIAMGVMIGVQVQETCLQEDLLEMIGEEEMTDVNEEIHPNVIKDKEIKKVEMVGLQSANVELTYELFVVHYWCMI